jgi:hypothetical protein
VFGTNKTFPGLLFITVPPEYVDLVRSEVRHNTSPLPSDAGTRTEPRTFFGFYFAKSLDRAGTRYEYKPVSQARLTLLYKEHRSKWILPQFVPDDNLESVGMGAAWLPVYPPWDHADIMRTKHRAKDVAAEHNDERAEASKTTAERAKLAAEVSKTEAIEQKVKFFRAIFSGSRGARVRKKSDRLLFLARHEKNRVAHIREKKRTRLTVEAGVFFILDFSRV